MVSTDAAGSLAAAVSRYLKFATRRHANRCLRGGRKPALLAAMDARIVDAGEHRMLYDPAQWPSASPADLDVERWRARGARPASGGRGNAWFLPLEAGREWVLRHYLRGGMARHVSRDAYVWLGAERTRAWREFRLLQALARQGLPVPVPVAARITHCGLRYRQDLVTERVADSQPLCDVLTERPLPAAGWRQLGRTLARFHAAGLFHADLNAANLLLQGTDHFYLIDLDRGTLGARPGQQARSVRRLRHSLDKYTRLRPGFHFDRADWLALQQGLAEPSSEGA